MELGLLSLAEQAKIPRSGRPEAPRHDCTRGIGVAAGRAPRPGRQTLLPPTQLASPTPRCVRGHAHVTSPSTGQRTSGTKRRAGQWPALLTWPSPHTRAPFMPEPPRSSLRCCSTNAVAFLPQSITLPCPVGFRRSGIHPGGAGCRGAKLPRLKRCADGPVALFICGAVA